MILVLNHHRLSGTRKENSGNYCVQSLFISAYSGYINPISQYECTSNCCICSIIKSMKINR